MINISIENFEGPYDLLLDLLKKQEIDIYNIPIHKITQDFLSVVEKNPPKEQYLADFIVFIALLLEIKSNMLLPDNMLDEYEFDEEDPRKVLISKLFNYQRLVEDTKKLKEIYQNSQIRYYCENQSTKLKLSKKTIDENLYDFSLIAKSYDRIILRKTNSETEKKFFLKLRTEKYSVEKKQIEIIKLLGQINDLMFNVFTNKADKSEKIAYFLAMLKLQQDQSIHVSQSRVFDPIKIERVKNEKSN